MRPVWGGRGSKKDVRLVFLSAGFIFIFFYSTTVLWGEKKTFRCENVSNENSHEMLTVVVLKIT
jgi:hypothetical protein